MRLARKNVLVGASALALVITCLLACGGSGAAIGNSGMAEPDSGAPPDGAASDGSPTPDGDVPMDGALDGPPDASVVVHESPAPTCNDLMQQGPIVTTVASPAAVPAQVPITTIAPGLYVLVSATDYGGATTIDPPSSSRVTLVFTATREYYVYDDAIKGGTPEVLNLDWKIVNNRLIRNILCAQSPSQVGLAEDYRVDAAKKGFIVYVPGMSSGTPGRFHAYQYERKD